MTLTITSTQITHDLIPIVPKIPIIPTAQLSLFQSETDTNIPGSTPQFLVRRGQMQRSAKMPPMGSTWRTSHWWHFLLAAADDPLSQEI